jgi:hypothetical protein
MHILFEIGATVAFTVCAVIVFADSACGDFTKALALFALSWAVWDACIVAFISERFYAYVPARRGAIIGSSFIAWILTRYIVCKYKNGVEEEQ